jgi:ubiquinone/menaquinone biosynthesis C-methylase UbiE
MLGRLGGLVMARGNRAANSEITGLLAIRAGDQILEVGYGPGELMRHLADQSPATSITGVDPSPVMQDMARRRCAAAVAAGRVDPQLGSATHTGLPAASFDHVVSVNNVIFWGGIPAGLAELHRVLRPGGCLVVAFHSRTAPSRLARQIGLPEDAAVQIQDAMRKVFGAATRHELRHLTAFTATRPHGQPPSGPA